jgi:3D (Asp-Asp-Asp) domain-containing protein
VKHLAFLLAPLLLIAAPADQPDHRFVATAYSSTGLTTSGQYTHRHVVAADPNILPIGTRIQIRRAGKYSGEYVVADTGGKITGRRLDIYLPSTQECKKFGKKVVRVRILELGNGTPQAAKQADQTVKQDVKKDVEKGTVGDAATEADWATRNAAKPPANSSQPKSNQQ